MEAAKALEEQRFNVINRSKNWCHAHFRETQSISE